MKMRFTALTFVLILMAMLSKAQYSYTKSLETGDTIGVINQIIKIFETNDNNFILYGDYHGSSYKVSFDIVKTDTALNPIWSTRISRPILPNENAEEFRDLVQLQDSGYMMTGLYNYPSNSTIGMMRLDKNGQFIMGKEINGVTNSVKASQVLLFNDSTLLLSVERYSSLLAHPVAGHIFTDLNANVKSSQFYHYNNPSYAGVIELTSDGGFINAIHAAIYPAGSFSTTVGIVKFDASGAMQWSRHFIAPAGRLETYDIKQMTNGNYIICGSISGPTSSPTEGFVMCVSSTGNLMWAKKHALFSIFYYTTVTLIGNDTIALAGSAFTPTTRQLVTLIDSSGTFLNSTGFLASQPYVITESELTHDNRFITLTITGWGNIIDKKIVTKTNASYLNICNSAAVPLTDISVPLYDSIQIAFQAETFFNTNIITTYTYDYTLPNLQTMCTAMEIEVLNKNNSIKVFPNPANNIVTIQLPALTNVKVSVGDITGKILLQQNHTKENNIQMPLSSFAPGMYIVSVISDAGNFFSQKLMIER